MWFDVKLLKKKKTLNWKQLKEKDKNKSKSKYCTADILQKEQEYNWHLGKDNNQIWKAFTVYGAVELNLAQ